MKSFSAAVRSHDVRVHTLWAAVWTGVFSVVAIVVESERPQLHWLLSGAVLMGMYHAFLLVGRAAERRGRTNPLTRRCTVFAWLFPVALPAFAVLNALTA